MIRQLAHLLMGCANEPITHPFIHRSMDRNRNWVRHFYGSVLYRVSAIRAFIYRCSELLDNCDIHDCQCHTRLRGSQNIQQDAPEDGMKPANLVQVALI